MEKRGDLTPEQKQFLTRLADACLEMIKANRLALFISKELVSFRPLINKSMGEIVLLLLSDDFDIKSTLFSQLKGSELEEEKVSEMFEAIKRMLAKSIDYEKGNCICGRTCGCARSLSGLSDEERKLILETD